MKVRFTQAARKRRIGTAHVLHVMASSIGLPLPAAPDSDPKVLWIGPDDEGRELEVIAVLRGDQLLVIHVMPARYRRIGRD